MNLPLGIGLATSAAVSFAAADFCGALVARRVTPLSAALSVQIVISAVSEITHNIILPSAAHPYTEHHR